MRNAKTEILFNGKTLKLTLSNIAKALISVGKD